MNRTALFLAALVAATPAAFAGPRQPPPPPPEKNLITLSATDFFAADASVGGTSMSVAGHHVVATSLNGDETFKGRLDDSGVVLFTMNSNIFEVTILCPDGHHAMFQQKFVNAGELQPMAIDARLKPLTRRLLQQDGSQDAFEPNDNTAAGAVNMAVPSIQAHNFGPGLADRDWLTFMGQADKVYDVQTSRLQRRTDTVLSVYQRIDGAMVEIQRNDDDATGFSSNLLFRAPASGRYYVLAQDFTDDAVSPQSGYSISVAELDMDFNDVGQTPATSKLLLPGDTNTGELLFPAADRDLYEVTLDPQQTYTWSVSEIEGLGDPQLRLLDADGVTVLSGNDDANSNTFGPSLMYRHQSTTSQTAYVEVSERQNLGGANWRYSVSAAAGTLPIADAGPDQRFCTPAARSISLNGNRSGNQFGPYVSTTSSAALIDISAWPGVTTVANGDDTFTNVTLPFTFNFYGGAKTTVNVASNGFLTFNAAGAGSFGNGAIPNAGTPNDALYAIWDDLNPTEGGQVLVASGVVDGNNAFVAQWRNVSIFGAAGAQYVNAEAILFESGCAEFRYGVGTAGRGTGGGATIGAENAPGTLGPQIALNNAAAGAAGTRYTVCPGPAVQVACSGSATVTSGTCGAINGAGTNTAVCDDCSTLVPLPFTFQHYGVNKNQVYICSNGFLSFTSSSCGFTNGAIPSTSLPNDDAMGFWDDLYPPGSGAGRVTHRTDGVTPNRIFRATWNNIPHFANGAATGAINYQISLYETTNRIEYCYGPRTGAGTAFSGTIGIENQAGTVATQLAFSSSAENWPGNGQLRQFNPAAPAPALTFDWDIDGDMDFSDGVTGATPTINITPNAGPDCASQRKQHVIWLRVRDCATGRTATDSMTIDNGDFTPPVVGANPTAPPAHLWSPNHDCVTWSVNDFLVGTDNCGAVHFVPVACSTSQAVEANGTGDGNFTPDCCVDMAANTFTVREERNGNRSTGEDRGYIVDVVATDDCGNSSLATIQLCVYHDSSSDTLQVCDYSTPLANACPGADNHSHKRCARP